jgi:hypothetical protein
LKKKTKTKRKRNICCLTVSFLAKTKKTTTCLKNDAKNTFLQIKISQQKSIKPKKKLIKNVFVLLPRGKKTKASKFLGTRKIQQSGQNKRLLSHHMLMAGKTKQKKLRIQSIKKKGKKQKSYDLILIFGTI